MKATEQYAPVLLLYYAVQGGSLKHTDVYM